MSSAGVGHFYGFKSSHRKKFDRKGWGKTSFNFHGIGYIEVGKNDFASNPRSFKLFLLFTSPEHYLFQSTGHVTMVKFKFQLTVCRKQMLLVMMKNKRKHTKTRCIFLNMNEIFERNHLKDDFEDKIINRIFSYKILQNLAKKFDHNFMVVF